MIDNLNYYDILTKNQIIKPEWDLCYVGLNLGFLKVDDILSFSEDCLSVMSVDNDVYADILDLVIGEKNKETYIIIIKNILIKLGIDVTNELVKLNKIKWRYLIINYLLTSKDNVLESDFIIEKVTEVFYILDCPDDMESCIEYSYKSNGTPYSTEEILENTRKLSKNDLRKIGIV